MILWNQKPYHSFDYMLRERFGEKVYKLALDGGATCPNRDGTVFSAAPGAPVILRATGCCP